MLVLMPSLSCLKMFFPSSFGWITGCGSVSLKLCVCVAASPWSQSTYPYSQCIQYNKIQNIKFLFFSPRLGCDINTSKAAEFRMTTPIPLDILLVAQQPFMSEHSLQWELNNLFLQIYTFGEGKSILNWFCTEGIFVNAPAVKKKSSIRETLGIVTECQQILLIKYWFLTNCHRWVLQIMTRRVRAQTQKKSLCFSTAGPECRAILLRLV